MRTKFKVHVNVRYSRLNVKQEILSSIPRARVH